MTFPIRQLYIAIWIIFTQQILVSQQAQVVFGKNRIQDKNFKWEYLSTHSFDIYFYYGGRESAIYAAKYAEQDYRDLCRFLGLSSYRNVKLLVYNTPKDLLMSNIGFEEPDPALGGVANFVKSKVEVCFQGDHAKFRNDIKKEIARYLVNESLYGGNIKEILKNTYLLNIPEWYSSGLAYFAGYGYTEELDNHVRSMAKTGKLKHPNILTGKDAELYGASIWNFIAQKYGQSNVANVLQVTQNSRSPKEAIAMVLGVTYREFIKQWRDYYLDMSFKLEEYYDTPDKSLKITKRNRKGATYSNVKVSTTGEYVTYTQNLNGRYKVYVYDIRTKKRKIIHRGGFKVFDQPKDETMPLVTLFADKIGVVDFKKGKFYLTAYNKKGKVDQKLELPEFENIIGIDFSDDANAVVISGQMNGQSDLWYLNFKDNAYRQLTLDYANDLSPSFVGGSSKSFVFSSNRKTDTLIPKKVYADKVKIKDFYENSDLFLFGDTKGATKLRRLTNTLDSEYQPIGYDDSTITYIGEFDGIRQLYKLDISSGINERITSFINSVKCYDLLPKTRYASYVLLHKNREHVYFDPNFTLTLNTKPITISPRKEQIDQKRLEIKAEEDYQKYIEDSLENLVDISELTFSNEEEVIDVDHYVFDSEKDTSTQTTAHADDADPNELKVNIDDPKPYKHDLGITSMSNSLVIDNLRGFGSTNNVTLLDMLGNHKIKGSITIFPDLRSSDMAAEYQYLKRRIDLGLRITKQRFYLTDNTSYIYKHGLNTLNLTASYPITPSTRISISPHLINQLFLRIVPLGQDVDLNSFYTGGNVELNIDNSEITGSNMRKGFRMHLMAENFLSLNSNQKSFTRGDLDMRMYQPVYNHFTLALRGAAGKFFGAGAKNFMLGGVDNYWKSNRYNYEGDNNPLNKVNDGGTDVFLNKFVTNVRGYQLNQVYGKNYFLLNAELRLPIAKFFFGKYSVGSSFIRNLQTFGFGDIGAAWTGANPFSRENTSSKTNYYASPFSGYSINYSTPVLTSFGFGFRSYILGYYLKLDIAYPIRDFVRQPTAYIFSLGHDF